MNRYRANPEEGEFLPNRLNPNNREEIDKSEFEGFLYAELKLTEELTSRTKFNVKYIQRLHKLAFYHLKSFLNTYWLCKWWPIGL